MDWLNLKLDLVAVTGLEKDAWHIYAALAVQAGTALLLRKSLGHPLPWLAVLVAAAANEWADMHFETWPDRSMQWDAAVHDLVNTMILPTLLLVAVRVVPRLFR